MTTSDKAPLPAGQKADCQVSEISIAQLVGQVYEAAPPVERSRLVEYLLRPLGVLSLVSVANGIFANIRFQNTWPDAHVHVEDVRHVRSGDVIALVSHVQQVSIHAIDGLASMLATSPSMTGSAAAALLVILMQRSRNRRADDLAA